MQPGRVIAGRFRVEAFVGSGGMGSVYRATDQATGEPVAIKVLRYHDEEIAARFADESRLLAEIRHSAIVRYVAHGATPEGDAYLAMEWLEGEDLASRLKRGALGVVEAQTVARRSAQALAAAHGRGIIHRDIKPSNLYLVHGAVDELKLLDFGIARRIASRRITATGLPIGTPAYMAPEQARAERVLDARVDVFSLGCVLFECLAGKPAFWGDHVLALLAKVVLEDAPRVRSLAPHVPRALDELVDRMLAKDPALRPRDAAHLLDELDRVPAETGSPATSVAPSASTGAATIGGLTRRERALVSVIVAAAPREDPALADTLVPAASSVELRTLVSRLDALGAALEGLADGSYVIVLKGRSNAKDLAVQAARAALAVAEALVGRGLALATGRGELRGGVPVGDAIDRAVEMLRAAPRLRADERRVLVDDVTRAFLPPRFELESNPFGVVLLGEGAGESDEGRTLLGKPTPFVGREHEMIVLEALADQSHREPSARAAVVLGAAGIGKSRLREELVQILAARGAPAIWTAAGDTPGTTPPLAVATEILRRAFAIASRDPPALTRRRVEKRLAELLPPADAARVAAVFEELLDARDQDLGPPSVRGDARLGGDRIRRAFLDWLDAECAARPVVIVLEDVHAADEPTVKLVDAALRELAERPLFVVGFGRPEAADAFPGLFVARGATRVDLRELGRAASLELVRSVAGPALDEAAIDAVVERAAGNAFYLEELVRRRLEGHADAVPETVLAMAEARIAEIDEEGRRLLRAASVFGRAFWRGGVALLLGEDRPEAIAPRLDDLTEREILVQRRSPRFAGEVEYRFRHALLREAAYAMLVDADRALGHRLAASFLETVSARDPRALAMHYDLGGLPERAVPWHVAAAEEGLARNDLAGALVSVGAGAKSGAFGPALGALRLAEAESLVWLGRFKDAEVAAKAALAELVPASAPWFAGVGVAVAAAVPLGHVDDVRPLVDAIVGAKPAAEAADAGAIAAARVASHLAAAGRHEWVDRLAAWVAAIAPALKVEPLTVGHLQLAHGMRAIAGGDLCVFQEAMRRAAEAFETAGDLRRACRARANAGFASSELGRYDEAEVALRAAVVAASRAGIPNAAAYANHNLGGVLARQGRLDEARAVELAAIESGLEQGDKRLESASRTVLSQILIRAGDPAGARVEAEAAAELASTSPPLRAFALGTLSGALLAVGEIAPALAAAREAHELLETSEAHEGESLVRLNHARALDAAGSPGAPAAFLEARDRLVARSRALSDPDLVPGFLRDVVENAAILARAAEIDRQPG